MAFKIKTRINKTISKNALSQKYLWVNKILNKKNLGINKAH